MCYLIFALFTSIFLSGILSSQTSVHGDLKIDCVECHSTLAWKPLKEKIEFDHSSTGFPLIGEHSEAYCTDCHRFRDNRLIFSDIKDLCSSCHFDFHSGELGDRCDLCHSFSTWRVQDMIRRHRRTRFPLIGTHASVDCRDCHIRSGIFQMKGLPVDCIECHEVSYRQARSPDHIEFKFGTDCTQCHSIRAMSWRGEFRHPVFPLGVHKEFNCIECHTDKFQGAPLECFSCHKDQYESAVNPPHTGFPTNCYDCHLTTAWRPAPGFDHDGKFFRIYSGKHRGKWSGCMDCHIDPNNYGVFSCTNCHEHSREKMDREHREEGVPGYIYESSACYSCHRNV